jgi:hypothetical protein
VDSGAAERFRLEGLVLGLDTSARTFRIRTQTVFYGDPAVVFDKGSAADLARSGARVKVEGVLSADGTRVLATKITIDD